MSNGISPTPAPEIQTEEPDGQAQDGDVEEVVIGAEYCHLPAPKFHRFRVHERIFHFDLAGNGYTLAMKGRRGCIRTEVANEAHMSLRMNIFGVRAEVCRTTQNNFRTDERATHTSFTHSRYGVDVEYKMTRKTGKKESSRGMAVAMKGPAGIDMNAACVKETEQTVKEKDGQPQSGSREVAETSKSTSRVAATLMPGSILRPAGFLYSREETTVEEKSMGAEPDLEGQPVVSEEPGQPPEGEKAKKPKHYLVIGLFSPVTGVPRERLITVKNPKNLFRRMWWEIMKLRGIGAILSLKDIKGFAVYQVCVQTDKTSPSRFRCKK
jgi:hypothetical protein